VSKVFVEAVMKPAYDSLDEEHKFYARNFYKLFKQYKKIEEHKLTNPLMLEYMKNPNLLKSDYNKRLYRLGDSMIKEFAWENQ
jgi:hypothetical protein